MLHPTGGSWAFRCFLRLSGARVYSFLELPAARGHCAVSYVRLECSADLESMGQPSLESSAELLQVAGLWGSAALLAGADKVKEDRAAQEGILHDLRSLACGVLHGAIQILQPSRV